MAVGDQVGRNGQCATLGAPATDNLESAVVRVHIGPFESARFSDLESAAIHEPKQELVTGGGGGGEYLADFAETEDFREMLRAFGGGETVGEGLAAEFVEYGTQDGDVHPDPVP